MAALLPNLATVRRPSKSAIVNSSIALIHTQHRLRAIAARELRQLAAEADALRREVNEWRSAHAASPVPSAKVDGAMLESVVEPVRSAEFLALIELEDVPEDGMNEQERIAYEMRGGDSGPFAASLNAEDGEDDFGLGGEDDLSDGQRLIIGQLSMQGQRLQQFSTTPNAPNVFPTNARARAQSLSVHLPQQQHQFADQQQQQAIPNLARYQQLQIDTQLAQAASAAAAASLVPSPYAQANPQQQQHQQYTALRHQQHQPQSQTMQMAPAGFSDPTFLPPSFDAIAAAAAAGFPAAQMQTVASSPISEQDATKFAAWNAHLFSAALVAQQQQREHQHQQQQRQFSVQFQTPPPTSHGPTARFGGNNQATSQHQQQQNQFQHPQRTQSEDAHTADEAVDASTPGSHASSAAPSLSGFSSASTGPGAPSPAGHPNSFPASPLHNLSLSGAQQDPYNGFAYESAPPATNWGNINVGKNPMGAPVVQTLPIPAGGGGGGGGYHQYPMMSMFV